MSAAPGVTAMREAVQGAGITFGFDEDETTGPTLLAGLLAVAFGFGFGTTVSGRFAL